MNQENSIGFRILARDIAQELTAEEIVKVNGGDCEASAKATWSSSKGADVALEVSCQN